MKFKKYINWLPLLLISVLGYFIYNHLSFYLKSMNKPSHHTGLLSKKLKENQTDDQDYFSFQQDGSQSALVPEIDEYSQDFVSVVPIKPTEQIEDIPLKVTSIEPVKTTQHLFKKLSKDIFSTKEERLQFFAELGLEYLNHTEFDYTPALDLDPKESDKYLADVQGYDLLSVQYADEIAAKKLIPGRQLFLPCLKLF